jgi:hypothetical protein
VDSVHGPWTTSRLSLRWTTVVQPRAQRHTCQSAARRRYGSPAVDVRGGGGRVGCSGARGALTGDGVAVKRPSDGGKAVAMKGRGGDEFHCERRGKRAVWGAAR